MTQQCQLKGATTGSQNDAGLPRVDLRFSDTMTHLGFRITYNFYIENEKRVYAVAVIKKDNDINIYRSPKVILSSNTAKALRTLNKITDDVFNVAFHDVQS